MTTPSSSSGSSAEPAAPRGSSAPGPTPSADAESESVPWVETRAGGMFFVNAILVSPIFMALYPWTLRWFLRVTGILNRPSRILDPVPAVADHFIPVLGWVTIPAIWLIWKNLGIATRPWARRALWIFLVTHVGTLIYTVTRVVG